MSECKEIPLTEKVGAVLVSGSGISGIQTSLDLAELGFKVYLLDEKPSIGGIMSQLDKTFPTNDCSICILAPKMLEAAAHSNIELMTYSEIEKVEGNVGNFKVTIRKKPRFIDESKCKNCGKCAQSCPVKVPNEFDAEISLRSAAYISSPQAVPSIHLIDNKNCLYLNYGLCRICEKICDTKAIDFNQKERYEIINVGAIIFTSGANIYNPSELTLYGYGKYKNVVTSLEFERISNASGPFGGHIQRLSNREVPKNIAWIQCVGSRNRAIGRRFCSSICCMYAIKEAIITKEHFPEIDCSIFYMDIRAAGKGFDEFSVRASEEYNIEFVPSRVSYIEEDPSTKNLILNFEDPETMQSIQKEYDLVVLSVGYKVDEKNIKLFKELNIELDQFNTCKTDPKTPLESNREGIFVCGTCRGPCDIPQCVSDASGAAAKVSELLSEVRFQKTSIKEYPPEINVTNQEPRIAVFVCHCGLNIAATVKIDEVIEGVKNLNNVIYAESNLYTCSQDTQEKIRNVIKENNVNRVVVASCTPRTHEKLFQNTLKQAGLNPYLFEMANIREQCSWVHMREPENATLKAIDLIKMAVEKAKLLKAAPKILIDVDQSALVIGGGISGLVSSLSLAKQGFKVHLVEKNSTLGGLVHSLHSILGGENPQKLIEEFVDSVKKEDKITVYTDTMVENVEGFVGNFDISLKHDSEISNIRVGCIIVSTGANENIPIEYMYGNDPRVLTQLDLEEKLKEKKIDAKIVTMIQCVESRDENRPYCSKICCSIAIKNALELKEMNPDIDIYILYRDIRVSGYDELFYEEARKKGVKFIRYDKNLKPKVNKDGDDLKVTLFDKNIESEIEIKPDLLILSTAFLSADNLELSKKLKVPLDSYGFYLEAHVKLRPLDFATDGIFVCGTASWPKFISECISQAQGAAARAGGILAKKKIEIEGFISVIDPIICIGCGNCLEICPYKAIKLVDSQLKMEELIIKRKIAEITPAQCKGCGTCVALCPVRAISQIKFTSEQILMMENSIII